MFKIDNPTKQEAVNFATVMNLLDCSETKAELYLNKLTHYVDLSIPLDDFLTRSIYSEQLKIDVKRIAEVYKTTYKAFTTLRAGDEIIKRGSHEYPPLLAQTEQAPRFLFIRGRKALLFEKRTVSLVGSRRASESAKEKTKKLAELLGENGIIVISGLAKGIDISAHRAALDGGYNTIAVIGTSLNQYYPSENMRTQKEIEERGLVVSQFSPASKTQRWFFPQRNGVMSGLSLATIIMEAGETSGALKQADFALKQGRQLLIPESVYKNPSLSWPKKYVEKGAVVVKDSFDDIIRVLSENRILKINNYHPGFEEILSQQSIEELLFPKGKQKADMAKYGKSVIIVE